MKRIIAGLIAAMLFCSLAHGINRTVTENDSQGNKKRVIELRDSTVNGKIITDTLSVMTYENSVSSSDNDSSANNKHHHNSSGIAWDNLNIGENSAHVIIAVTAIVFIFGLPLFIVFTIFFFRYKNRKAKYRLAEQALSSGQPLPEHLFKHIEVEDIRSKGIKNVFTGIGLFIFLWAITGKFGLGCIGLLIMFTGFGQLVIYYSQQKKNEEK